MESYENLITELLGELSPRKKHERILELLEKEKELSTLKGYVDLVEQTREAMMKDHPNIARFIPTLKQ